MILEQSFRTTQVTQCPQIGQSKREAVLVLIAHRPERKAAKLHAHAAAIPVVGSLDGRVLQEIQICIESYISRGAESRLVGVPITEQETELIEALRRGDRIQEACLGREVKQSVARSHGKKANVIVHEDCAGIGLGLLEVVVDIPFDIGVCAALNT